MIWCIKQITCSSNFTDGAMAHHGNLVTHLSNYWKVVRYKKHRQSQLILKVFEQI